MKDLGTECRDVRTHKVGIQEIHQKVQPYEVEFIRRDYIANGGWETFLSDLRSPARHSNWSTQIKEMFDRHIQVCFSGLISMIFILCLLLSFLYSFCTLKFKI